MSKVSSAALEKQFATLRNNLRLLQESLDKAVETGDLEAVKKKQADIAANEALVASYARRIEKARLAETDEQKQVRKTENLAAVDEVRKAAEHDVQLVAGIKATLDQLFSQIATLQDSSKPVRELARNVFVQMSRPQQERNGWLLNDIGHSTTTLAAYIEDHMLRAGMFSKLAPADSRVRLLRHDLGDMTEGYARRVEKLSSAFASAVHQINESI